MACLFFNRSLAQALDRFESVNCNDDSVQVPEGAARPRSNAKVALSLREDPGQRIIGTVVWFNLSTLSYKDKDQTPHSVAWADLAPERLDSFIAQLPDRKDAEGLLIAAEILIQIGGEKKQVEQLLAYAERADANAADRIAKLRASLDNADPPQDKQPLGPNPGEKEDQADPAEAKYPKAWPTLTAEQSEKAINDMISFTDAQMAKLGLKMEHTQTERFIVYSDLTADESRYWVSLVDKMYDRMCEIFDIDKKQNIWRGKGLLIFFAKKEDYERYNNETYEVSLPGSAGICRTRGNGDVHILMYQQSNQKDTAKLLVHEATHGFLARYKSRIFIDSWLDEGLAEYVSANLVDAKFTVNKIQKSHERVKKAGRIGDFLSAENINFDDYGMAYELTDMMIKENRKGYVEMIRGIKQGLSVEEAFTQKYGVSIEKIFAYYAKTRLEMDQLQLN